MPSFFSRFLTWFASQRRETRQANRARWGDASQRRSRHNTRLELEPLEPRIVLSSYVVTSSLASGAGSLAAEISAALAANDQAATITFASGLVGDTISPASGNSAYGPTAFFINGASGTNITINGANAPGVVVSGSGSMRLFVVAGADALTLENLTVAGGLRRGARGATRATI